MKLARSQGRVPLAGAGFDTSRKIPEEVFASGQPRLVADLLDGHLAEGHTSTIALGIRHVLCVPLKLVRYVDEPQAQGELRPMGVLYLDSREATRLHSENARLALETLAVEAAGAIENARLYREAREKARIDGELRIASQIQQALLPQARKQMGFCEAMGASIPCRAIGGDFYDYLDLPDGRFGFALGDVSGKGPPAALLTAVLQGIFAAQTFVFVEPRELMMRVNRVLLARKVDARFATIFFGVLTPAGELTYCNAGHNPPLLLTGGTVRRLETGGTVAGLFPDASYDQETVLLSAGDRLTVFSDGVCEAMSAAGEEFGEGRIREAMAATGCESTEVLMQTLLASVKAFASGTVQQDDVTAMVVKYLG
jgi:sigma-B regulation protein RsbU (phosphoserine phosphatase)